MKFSDLNLLPQILDALHEKGYREPTPVQEQTIPAVMAGRDVLSLAQTGTGKTAAFALPILHILGTSKSLGFKGSKITASDAIEGAG